MLEKFAFEAQRYVNWVSSKDGKSMEAATALRRIVALYAAALELPSHFSEVSSSGAEHQLGFDEAVVNYGGTASLPFRNYGEVFDPLLVPPEEPVIGDIADDIGDIYRDIVAGLKLYSAGRPADALLEWSVSFRSHWGKHATSAIRALHCYLANGQIERRTDGA
jgi:Domain of unknown function (DUF5063)